jgi:trimeric autotransporter adhesin
MWPRSASCKAPPPASPQIAGIQTQVDDNRREARAGTALALATSGLHFDPRPGKASLAAAFGNYKGMSGLAVGLGYAVSDRWRFNAAVPAPPRSTTSGWRPAHPGR